MKKLSWYAKPKVCSLENTHHQPGGGRTAILIRKLSFKNTAIPKVDSITDYKPAGGQKKILSRPMDFKTKAKSKIGSLGNVSHKPQGGDKKVSLNIHVQLTTYLRDTSAPYMATGQLSFVKTAHSSNREPIYM